MVPAWDSKEIISRKSKEFPWVISFLFEICFSVNLMIFLESFYSKINAVYGFEAFPHVFQYMYMFVPSF